jgi:hypothetical protein
MIELFVPIELYSEDLILYRNTAGDTALVSIYEVVGQNVKFNYSESAIEYVQGSIP